MQPNVFFVKKSEISGRIDPLQFHQERRETLAKLKAARQTVHLISVTHARKQVVSESKKPYIGLENIQSNTGEYIETNEKSTFSSANVFMKGDILFPKLRPYLNKVHLAEFDGICSTEFHVFNSNGQYLNEFLTIYLRSNLIVNQTKYLMTGNTLPRLQTADIHQLPIPVVDLDFQAALVAKYQQAEQARQAKLAQADTLSGSIQDYLLRELGITVPQADNALNKRIFTVSTEQLDNRIDPLFYFHRENKMSAGKFENVPLGKIATLNKGTSLNSNSVIDGDYPVIAGGQSSPYNHHVYNFSGENITVSASGAYSGYVWFHDYPIFASDCTVVKSKNEQEVLTKFLYEVMKLKQEEIYRLRKGAVQPHVYAVDLEKIQIPLPPLDTQRAIVAHIAQIRAQIAALQQEAADLLADTQREMERLILG
ncbi:restriction endonuclease subunit S [Exercitatus varius]|uniref:restriction endonuclease subunit S n=1 Tax=Exercitatus varius TaxID=67857 RepID=UPI00294B546C|nr:restriction endonuclease subunit S [Exercitatus varius]MDG2952641.1 restriction endonuclease subunit S [Exercitatus varius]